MSLKKVFFKIKSALRNIFSFLLCKQECILCKAETTTALPLCETCIKEKFEKSLEFRISHDKEFCQNCSRHLISEKEFCTACRAGLEEEKPTALENTSEKQECDKIFAIYPYQADIGKTLIQWKNFNNKVFAEFFAQIIAQFINSKEELQNIEIVPVPPRPKKMKTKGWDQIEDLCSQLETCHKIKVERLLKRRDGVSQKKLSSKLRKSNLKGKIYQTKLKANQKIPKTLIIIDDVITTGSTLNSCAKVLKDLGCEQVFGLSIFFD